jgi:hypothetical protein
VLAAEVEFERETALFEEFTDKSELTIADLER